MIGASGLGSTVTTTRSVLAQVLRRHALDRRAVDRAIEPQVLAEEPGVAQQVVVALQPLGARLQPLEVADRVGLELVLGAFELARRRRLAAQLVELVVDHREQLVDACGRAWATP